jgi:hypothetical protein
MSSRFPAWSKRVSELLETLANLVAALIQFGIHDVVDSAGMMFGGIERWTLT